MGLQDFTLNLKANADNLDKSIRNVTDRTYTVKLKADGSSVRTLTQDVTSADGKLQGVVKTMKTFDAQGKELNTTITQSAKNIKTWGQEFSDSFGKVLRFGTITAIIGAFTKAMYEAVDVVKEFDDAITEFKKVSDLSGESLNEYTKQLGELGQTVARTRSEMVSSATEFVKSGYSEEDAAQLTRISELYRNIADEAISSGESANFIISQMKAFSNDTEEFALHTINAINNVSNNMAVSSSDISEALSKTSSAMGALGNTYEQTIALVTSGTEIMQGQASKVARGLRTIGNNIANAAQGADTLEISVQGVTKQINLLDSATGDMRSTFDIMQDIFTSGWEDMTNSEKQALAISLAGKNQFEVFVSVLENFADAQQAVTLATNSANSAEKENEAYLDSLGAKLNQAKALLQELVLGEGGLQSFAKSLLDVGISILKFANSDIGQAIIKTALLTTALLTAKKALDLIMASNFISWASNGVVAIELLAQAMIGFATKTATASDVLAGFNILLETLNINPVILALTAFIGVIVGVSVAIDKYNKRLDDAKEKLNDLSQETNSAQSEVDSLTSSLENVQNKLKDLKSSKLEITDEDQLKNLQNQTSELEKQEDALKRQLALAIQKSDITKQEAAEQAKETLATTTESPFFDYSEIPSSSAGAALGIKLSGVTQMKSEDILKSVIDKYKSLQVEMANYQASMDREEQVNGRATETYIEMSNHMAELENKLKELESIGSEYSNIVNEANDSMKAVEENDYTQYLDGLVDGWNDVSGATEKAEKSIGGTSSDFDDFNENIEEQKTKLEEITDRWEQWNADVDDIQSAYETLTKAVEEYNEQGGYTTDTLQQLLALDPAYLAALQEENGQLTLNTEMLMTKVQAQAEEAKQIIYNTAIEKLNAIASGDSGDAAETAGQQHNNASEGIDTETASLNENTKAKLLNAAAEARARGGGAVEGDVQKILRETQDELEAVDNWVETVSKDFSKGMGKASKSTSKATKAVDEQKSAVDQLKDKYKTVIDFILKQYDKQIDKIKEAKDAAIKSVESQIKALEKEKDSRLKAIDAEITALQRQRDAREKYWQEQLDKLEKENNERQRNIELQEKQQALALAQQSQVMLLKDGRFQYGMDETAVAGAEQDLAQTEEQNEYERQKELIEELRDTELEWYDERIQTLEDYKEQVEEYYEEQIEQLEEYKEYLEEYYDAQIEMLEAEKEAVNATLEEGAANQQEYWDKMKEQLQTFVEEWNALVGEMTFPNISGSGISLSAVGGKISASMGAKSTGDNKVSAYASGKGSIGDSEIAVVGENPKYRELVIGSKLNNDQGVVMNLKRGSGVVNADSTNTLASVFNSLSGQRSIGQSVNNTNQSTNITIGSISLPEVTDGQGFVDYLQNFSADITQQSFRRA